MLTPALYEISSGFLIIIAINFLSGIINFVISPSLYACVHARLSSSYANLPDT